MDIIKQPQYYLLSRNNQEFVLGHTLYEFSPPYVEITDGGTQIFYSKLTANTVKVYFDIMDKISTTVNFDNFDINQYVHASALTSMVSSIGVNIYIDGSPTNILNYKCWYGQLKEYDFENYIWEDWSGTTNFSKLTTNFDRYTNTGYNLEGDIEEMALGQRAFLTCINNINYARYGVQMALFDINKTLLGTALIPIPSTGTTTNMNINSVNLSSITWNGTNYDCYSHLSVLNEYATTNSFSASVGYFTITNIGVKVSGSGYVSVDLYNGNTLYQHLFDLNNDTGVSYTMTVPSGMSAVLDIRYTFLEGSMHAYLYKPSVVVYNTSDGTEYISGGTTGTWPAITDYRQPINFRMGTDLIDDIMKYDSSNNLTQEEINSAHYIVITHAINSKTYNFPIHIVRNNPNPMYVIHYMNRRGGMSYLLMRGKNTVSMSYEKTNYERNNYGFYGNINNQKYYNRNTTHKTVNYETKETRTFKLNSGRMTDSKYAKLEDIIWSPLVYVEFPETGEIYPVTVVDENFTYKNYNNDKVFNFYIELKQNN